MARAALAGKVNGKLVDTNHVVDNDADVAIITERDEEGLDIIRHSTSHLMAQAVNDTLAGLVERGKGEAFVPEQVTLLQKQ